MNLWVSVGCAGYDLLKMSKLMAMPLYLSLYVGGAPGQKQMPGDIRI
jgi:hypothetical protein